MYVQPVMRAALAGSLLASCTWLAPANDAGDVAFVVDVIPTLLGRKAHNPAEIQALVDLAALEGREAVVDLLLEQPEYVDYWSEVLIDALRVDRTGTPAQDPACYGDPLLEPGYGDELLAHLATADATVPFFLRKRPESAMAAPAAWPEGPGLQRPKAQSHLLSRNPKTDCAARSAGGMPPLPRVVRT